MPSYLFHFTNLPLITHLSTTTSLTTSSSLLPTIFIFFFFFNDTAPTEIYPLPLHDALPIYRAFAIAAGFAAAASLLSLATARTRRRSSAASPGNQAPPARIPVADAARTSTLKGDRKSTRLNSSHDQISYAVFCLKKKKIKQQKRIRHDVKQHNATDDSPSEDERMTCLASHANSRVRAERHAVTACRAATASHTDR